MSTEVTEIGLRLLSIQTEQYAVNDALLPQSDSQIYLNFDIGYGHGAEYSIIASHKITFNTQSDKPNPFITIEVSCEFDIDAKAFESMLDAEANNIVLPQALAIHMSTIVLGALRGVLHEKTRNSEFSKFPLPLIRLSDMIKDDVSIGL